MPACDSSKSLSHMCCQVPIHKWLVDLEYWQGLTCRAVRLSRHFLRSSAAESLDEEDFELPEVEASSSSKVVPSCSALVLANALHREIAPFFCHIEAILKETCWSCKDSISYKSAEACLFVID